MKPSYYFKSIHEAREYLQSEPENIEYLNIWTGETFIHSGGTAYWGWHGEPCLNLDSLLVAGISHWREVSESRVEAMRLEIEAGTRAMKG